MASSTRFAFSNSILVIVTLSFLVSFLGISSAQLSTDFYSGSCPKALSIVRSVVQSAISGENRVGASLLRLHFHDCFVNGCDASVLLDDTSSFTGEKTAAPNANSLRGFDVIDKIKTKLEKECPGIVSCADIATIAARDSVAILGGPSWNVKLGRRDAKTASLGDANSDLPGPNADLSALITKFKAKGLSTQDMVALSGAHTIGKARCTVFRPHIYNDTNIDASFANTMQQNCPFSTTGSGDNNLAPLDTQTTNAFDPKYFQNLLNKKGLLHSDQELFNGGSTDSLVKSYGSSGKSTFFDDFAKAMIKMGEIEVVTGSKGEIRRNCRKRN